MKRRSIALILSTMLVAGMALTGCDENGLPTEEEMNEITAELDDFSASMEDVVSNVSEFSDGIEDFNAVADTVESEVDAALGEDVLGSIDSIDDVSEIAGEISEEAGTVVDAVDASAPELEKLAEDVMNGYNDVDVIADDIVNIYSKEEVQQLINELETMIK